MGQAQAGCTLGAGHKLQEAICAMVNVVLRDVQACREAMCDCGCQYQPWPVEALQAFGELPEGPPGPAKLGPVHGVNDDDQDLKVGCDH
jgi:hypothetical protein